MADLSIISASSVVRGNLEGNTSLRIDGRVRGDISITGDVLLGATAQVAGNILGAAVSISGSVEGDISASVSLILEKSAKVVGNLSAPRIGIAEGALVRGNVQSDGASGDTRAALPATSFATRTPALAARSAAATTSSAASAARPAAAERTPLSRAVLPSRSPARTEVIAKTPARTKAAGVAEAAPSATPQGSLNLDVTAKPFEEAAKLERKAPPPPVVSAPSKIAKGRKKAAKRG